MDDATQYGITHHARNLPNDLNLAEATGNTQRVLTGELPAKYALPAAPDGHHWVFPKNGKPYTKRKPGYQGERMDYDHETQRFYVSKKHETTPGSTRYKAEFAEARGYEWAEAQGHKLVAGFKRPTYGQHGVDGLFLNASPPPKYFIIEIKYHKSTYGWTVNGKQMSDEWIEAKLRKQLSPRLLEDIRDNGYAKIGLRYVPELDRMIPEIITW